MLKIDIDSFDCDLLATLLTAGLRPKFLALEVNPNVPPPLHFSWRFDPAAPAVDLSINRSEWDWMLPLFGCSLATQAAVAAEFGYGLVFFWGGDAVFARSDLLPRLAPLLTTTSVTIPWVAAAAIVARWRMLTLVVTHRCERGGRRRQRSHDEPQLFLDARRATCHILGQRGWKGWRGRKG